MKALALTVLVLAAAPAAEAGTIRMTVPAHGRTVAHSTHQVRGNTVARIMIAGGRPVAGSCSRRTCFVYGRGIVVRFWGPKHRRFRVSASSERGRPIRVVVRWWSKRR